DLDIAGSAINVAVTVAHELGHNLGMNHDEDDVPCSCPDPQGCIMKAVGGEINPLRFSTCSVNRYLEFTVDAGLGYCMSRPPEPTVKLSTDGPKCGNRILEAGEDCDCGLAAWCNNSCCNPTTCKFNPGASCASGQCCNITTCSLISRGTECRAARGVCDLPEFCNGSSEWCPEFDDYVLDGTACAVNPAAPRGPGLLLLRRLHTRDSRCHAMFNGTNYRSAPDSFSNLTADPSNTENGYCNYRATAYNRSGIMSEPFPMPRWKSMAPADARLVMVTSGGGGLDAAFARLDLRPTGYRDPGMTPDGAECGARNASGATSPVASDCQTAMDGVTGRRVYSASAAVAFGRLTVFCRAPGGSVTNQPAFAGKGGFFCCHCAKSGVHTAAGGTDSGLYIGIGVAAAIVFLLLVVGVSYLLWRRCRAEGRTGKDQTDSPADSGGGLFGRRPVPGAPVKLLRQHQRSGQEERQLSQPEEVLARAAAGSAGGSILVTAERLTPRLHASRSQEGGELLLGSFLTHAAASAAAADSGAASAAEGRLGASSTKTRLSRSDTYKRRQSREKASARSGAGEAKPGRMKARSPRSQLLSRRTQPELRPTARQLMKRPSGRELYTAQVIRSPPPPPPPLLTEPTRAPLAVYTPYLSTRHICQSRRRGQRDHGRTRRSQAAHIGHLVSVPQQHAAAASPVASSANSGRACAAVTADRWPSSGNGRLAEPGRSGRRPGRGPRDAGGDGRGAAREPCGRGGYGRTRAAGGAEVAGAEDAPSAGSAPRPAEAASQRLSSAGAGACRGWRRAPAENIVSGADQQLAAGQGAGAGATGRQHLRGCARDRQATVQHQLGHRWPPVAVAPGNLVVQDLGGWEAQKTELGAGPKKDLDSAQQLGSGRLARKLRI
uniref:Peptidase M12B domain-containing protein n=1 Tax=Macrostomum lignano TaxID=282301 RepID=A0A1I8JP55_9PLAT